jgi:DNA-binding transcriptional ArsR family regulator
MTYALAYYPAMTTATLCEITRALRKIGIGMAEAEVFTIAERLTIRAISARLGICHRYSINQLQKLREKGLIEIDRSKRPAIYRRTKDGQRAIESLIKAGMS